MNTHHASRDRRLAALAGVVCSVRFGLAAVLCMAACSSKNPPSTSNPNQAFAGTPAAASGNGSVTPAASGGAGALAAPTGTGGAGVSVAGAGTPSAGRSAAAPAAGISGSVAMMGRGGSDAMPAAGGSGTPAAGTGGAPAAGVGGTPAGGAGGMTNTGDCTRELLKTTIDTYYMALAAHDPKMLPVSDTVKFTENGKTLMLGQGLWANAGMVKFKESLLDTQKCGTVTQSVVPDGSTDIPLAVRLKLVGQKITEIQTIAVRSGDYIVASNTANMIALKPWGDIVPEADRQPRDQLEKWIDKYFRMFPMGVCNISSDCKRMENGFTLMCSAGASCSSQEPSGAGVMKPQIILADVEAGMAAGFTMFTGTYSDVHMVKYSGGQVHGVHTVLGEAASSGWD